METQVLTALEQNELERCEVVIKQGLETFIEVGQALLTIREKRLYRLEFGTFEDYCRDRWGMEKSQTYRLIDAAKVIDNISPIGELLPKTESQARPLTQLQPEAQREAWREVVQQSEATSQPITAAKVQDVVNTFKQAKQEYREAREVQRAEQLQKKTEGTTVPIDQLERIAKLENGETIILNMNRDHHVLKYAMDKALYVRCDRFSDWGNPFIMGVDGDRDEVCNLFDENYLPFKRGLLAKIGDLKGKALGCHCYPERCHCETLKAYANGAAN